MSVLVLTERQIRQAVSMPEAMMAMEEAFASLARGEARLPDVIGLEIPEVDGEIHVKGAHLQGAAYAVFKVATGFWENPALGLPSSSGLMMASRRSQQKQADNPDDQSDDKWQKKHGDEANQGPRLPGPGWDLLDDLTRRDQAFHQLMQLANPRQIL